MEYYSLLGFTREPFSNSPDPSFFYRSSSHGESLNRLEIAVRLKRGVNVVLGEVGTGKTTLSRMLLRSLTNDKSIRTYLVLDPYFATPDDFLAHLYVMFSGEEEPVGLPRREVTERLKKEIYRQALECGDTLVLVIDEGQKVSVDCLEVIRELLNYETNSEKLLQVIIFGQNELASVIDNLPNLRDRINEYLQLEPLTAKQTREMIHYRLRVAGGKNACKIFPWQACRAIHRVTQGHPRRIMHLAHQSLLALIIRNDRKVSPALVKACAARTAPQPRRWLQPWAKTAATAAGVLCLGLLGWQILGMDIGRLAAKWTSGIPAINRLVSGEDVALPLEVVPKNSPSASSSGNSMAAAVAGRNVGPAFPVAGEVRVHVRSVPSADVYSVAQATDLAAGPLGKASEPPRTENNFMAADATEVPKQTPRTVSAKGKVGKKLSAKGGAEQVAVLETAVRVRTGRTGEPAAPFPEQPAASADGRPTTLGYLVVQRGSLVSRMIDRVYGVYRDAYRDEVKRANPLIRDFKHLEIGDRVHLPAIPFPSAPDYLDGYVLRIGEFDALGRAYAFLRAHSAIGAYLRLVPYWNPQSGMRFVIIGPGVYKDMRSAEKALHKYEAAAGIPMSIVHGFPQGTKFYHNFHVPKALDWRNRSLARK